ncbi:MAG: hypothetical protein KDB63_00875 [Nocardioidaceae bacterium]|nr:hypothetical protein [Nocardioidaceae bacterium]
MLPRIVATDTAIGFHWASPEGVPMPLSAVIALPGAEPDRWLPTHLEALDDVLIEVAGRFGEVLGGGRGPAREEWDDLAAAYLAIDRACREYADALLVAGMAADLRAGQILGTASLMGVRLRYVVGMAGAPPFDGELDDPGLGVVGGRAGLHWVDETVPWRGARWLVVTDDGRRLPASLSMLLFDSSGVDKDATRREHREALAAVVDAVSGVGVDPLVATGALDWLLFDWVMAHRPDPDSGAVELTAAQLDDARLIVAATAASARLRSSFDPGLMG